MREFALDVKIARSWRVKCDPSPSPPGRFNVLRYYEHGKFTRPGGGGLFSIKAALMYASSSPSKRPREIGSKKIGRTVRFKMMRHSSVATWKQGRGEIAPLCQFSEQSADAD